MAYIFMDESGDLGFDFLKKKTSKFFIVSFLFISDEAKKKKVEKIIKKVFAGFSKKEVKFHHGTLHAFKETQKVRTFILGHLSQIPVSVMAIRLNKTNVHTSLRDEMHILYNYVTNILIDRILKKKILPRDRKIHLIASQRETNKFLNVNFKAYLEKQAKNKHEINIEVEITPFFKEKCLQVIDFVSWSLFRYKERGDNFYRKQIDNLIIDENDLFP
ncbi:DUF3800 domain-containing protein [Candidatus Peregrinibacteria bacterium]|nr:DUF3800 domain-containing protein [Candidatus Peregrinibacteria bacterium]